MRSWSRFLRLACALLALGGTVVAAGAHDLRVATLTMTDAAADSLMLTVTLDAQDVDQLIALDDNVDGMLQWREFDAHRDELAGLVTRQLGIGRGSRACGLHPRHGSGVLGGQPAMLALVFTLRCLDAGESMTIQHQLLTDVDPAYPLLLRVGAPDAPAVALAPGTHRIAWPVNAGIDQAGTAAGPTRLVDFATLGVHHILTGLDHVAFLLLLLLPVARDGSLRQQLLAVAGIVTAFTLAHSVTLSLAVNGSLTLPGRPVEIVIAASVILAGVLNALRPRHRIGWLLAYAFGLVHGVGFAGALAETTGAAGLPVPELIAFNVGVEVGQLLLVSIALPLLATLGDRARFRRVVQPAISLSLAASGVVWLAQRL